MWSILAFIVIGCVAGWAASLLIRGEKYPQDWGLLFVIGVAGSLIAGLIGNLIFGDTFKIQVGGVIGSIVVACLLLWIYTTAHNRTHARRETNADGSHRERKGGRKHQSKR